MGTTERRQRHRASLRREILDAASQLFVEEGYDRLTMRRLAERIEYSPTTIYLYFKDKNDLLQAVCEETFSRLAGQMERQQEASASPLGFLREWLRTYVEFGLAHPAQYMVTFMSRSPGLDGGASPAVSEPILREASDGLTQVLKPSPESPVGSRAFHTLRQGVRACVENGDIQAVNIDMTAQALWASVHGITSLFITMPGFPFVALGDLVDHTIDTLIAGLKTPVASPPKAPVPRKSKKWEFFD